MEIAIKKYQDITSGEEVFILNEDTSFFTLNNGSKILKTIFDKKYFEIKVNNTESIDPNSFFNIPTIPNANSIVEQLSKIDASNVIDINDKNPDKINIREIGVDGSVKQHSGYSATENIVKYPTVDKSKYRQIDEDDPSILNDSDSVIYQTTIDEQREKMRAELKRQYTELNGKTPEYIRLNDNPLNDNQLNSSKQTIQQSQPIQISPEEEQYNFFKFFKKNYTMSVNISIIEKIAEPSFIANMKDNFEADVIKYYSKQIINNVLSDTSKLENEIYKQIEDLVNPYLSEPVKTPKKRVLIPKTLHSGREKLNDGYEKKEKIKKTKRTTHNVSIEETEKLNDGVESKSKKTTN